MSKLELTRIRVQGFVPCLRTKQSNVNTGLVCEIDNHKHTIYANITDKHCDMFVIRNGKRNHINCNTTVNNINIYSLLNGEQWFINKG